MRVVITFATTGDTFMHVSSGRFDTMRAWQLREFCVRYIEGIYFEWTHFVNEVLLRDAVNVRVYASVNQITVDAELRVLAVRRKVTALTADDMVLLLPAIASQDRLQ